MGDRDHRLVELVHGSQRQHVLEALSRVAGGLVGEHDGRLGDQRPRHRYPLLLAAGKLGGAVGAAILEADGTNQLLEPGPVGLVAGDRERQDQVLLRGQHGQEVEELEDEAELVATQFGQIGVVEG
jgi:hypothetical protein